MVQLILVSGKDEIPQMYSSRKRQENASISLTLAPNCLAQELSKHHYDRSISTGRFVQMESAPPLAPQTVSSVVVMAITFF